MPEVELTDKQSRFIDEYMVDFNATKAAIRAGYSVDSAKAIGFENLTKPYLREEIDRRLKQLELSAQQTTKLIADIAKSSLNEYFIVKEKEIIPTKRVPIIEVIKKLEDEIKFEDEFAILAKYSEEENQIHIREQAQRKRRLLRLNLTLEKNPNATELIEGEPVIIQVADLDIPKLISDKEAGKIKSVKYTEHGLNIEMYAADAALTNIARMHGLFEKDNRIEHSGNFTLSELPISFK